MNDLEMALGLLKDAVCPNCDGSGATQVRVFDRQYVSREMARDAGCPEMEGSLYSDDEWEAQPCSWCETRKQLLEKSL